MDNTKTNDSHIVMSVTV